MIRYQYRGKFRPLQQRGLNLKAFTDDNCKYGENVSE